MVSIVIVTMGVDAELRACLASLRAHVKSDYELILVNNASLPLDLTADITIENGRNLGFARAVNRGIAAARGERILLLNPDTTFTSDVITPMLAFMDAHPAAGICGLQLTFPDGRDQNSIDVMPTLLNQFMNKALLKILFPRAYPSKRSGFREPVRVPSVIGACMLLSRSMLEAIGDLDEGFFFYLEETDLCKRAAENGYEVWHLPQIKLIHHQGVTARKSDIRRTIEFRRSLMRFFRKHHGPAAYLFVVLSIVKATIEVAGNLPLAFVPKVRARLLRAAAVLAWHLLGMPAGFGLERATPRYRTMAHGGYRWFLTGTADPAANPEEIMQGLGEVLNDSRTTYVKRGRWGEQGKGSPLSPLPLSPSGERGLKGGEPWPLGEREIIFKRYNYKGLVDTLKNLFRKSRARRAFEAALLLENLGVDTPAVLFACERRFGGILLASYIATACLPARNLVEAISAADSAAIIRVSRLLRRLHAMGVIHVDLKGENLLVDATGRLYLIDLDRLKRVRFPSLAQRVKNLSYLNASFAARIPREQRLAFLDAYVKGDTWLETNRATLAAGIQAYTRKRLRTR